ncbi:hypothetical protein BV898_08056 [Hypsibius exemplaris]|uniref:Uncharacterized protein n=1 Tax=Hypsibius exemplaris TaxID=2072580 RepID=A0A1W0WRY2_HYPEX|nr:hypothetical protein BV898_08056 [Hypsibius exemplaris]
MDYNHQLYDSSRLNYQTRSSPENHNNNVRTNGNGGGGTRRTGAVTVAGEGGHYSHQGSNGQGNGRQILEHPAIKGLQNLRRNSIQRKIYEHQIREAETTKSVNQALVQARPITQGHLLAAPSVPTRKLSSSTPNLSLISESEQFLGPPQSGPRSLINGSPSQPSYLNGYQQNEQIQNQARNHLQQVEQYQQPHQTQPQQQSMNLGAHNGTNGYSHNPQYLQSHNGAFSGQISPASPAVQIVPNQQQEENGLERQLANLMDDLYGRNGAPPILSSSAPANDNKHTTGQAAQAASQRQLTFGGTMVHPPFNTPVESVSFNIIQAHANQNEAYQQQSTYQIQSGFFNQNAHSTVPTSGYQQHNTNSYRPTMNSYSSGTGSLSSDLMSPISDIVMTSDNDYSVSFPLADDEVSSYSFEVPTSANMDWNSNAQSAIPIPRNTNPQSSGSQSHTPYGTQPTSTSHKGTVTPPYVSFTNDLKPHESVEYRPRVASMPSMSLRTIETNRAALCGSVVVDRAVKKPALEPQPINSFVPIPVPTITITDGNDRESFNCYKQPSFDSGNCDDLISFLNGNDNAWDLNSLPGGSGQANEIETFSPAAELSISDLDERFQLVDSLVRRELGLSSGNDAD